MGTRYILLVGCILAFVDVGWAARRVDVNARARDTMRRRRDIVVIDGEEPVTLDTPELLQLTEGETMKEIRRKRNSLGTNVERLQEEYKGIPVFDSMVTIRKDDMGHLTGDASGTLIQDIGEDLQDIEPYLTDIETLNIAINAEGDEEMRDLIGDIKYKKFVYMDDKDKARLVNSVSYLIDGQKKPSYIIDLKTGEILKHWQSFKTLACCHKSQSKAKLYGGNEMMGKVEYGSQPYCIQFKEGECGKCYLENKYVRVIDMKQTEDESISETVSFPCDEGYHDEVNGAYSPALDAYFHGTVVGKMFEEWYNKTALEEPMIARVHYGVNYTNAFWNSVNATFGDGLYSMVYPFTLMDIVGHEFGHGVVEQGSDLVYYGEPGGVNEAFADIVGETVEAFFMTSDFITGKHLLTFRDYLREFEMPSRDKRSIGHVSDMTPDLDPHLSSGIYRRVWYIVVREQGMEAREAFEVFMYANEMYWHYLSSFYDVSCGLLKAAMDLGVDTSIFAIAFDDVGIPKCDVQSHVFSLSNNKTQRGVTISDISQPVFGFQMPPWASSMYVEAISPSGNDDIAIQVYNGSWEQEENNNASLVTEGITRLKLDVNQSGNDISETQFFFKFHTRMGKSYTDAEITAGYICDEDFISPDCNVVKRYWYYCFGEG